jgi:hypothetical protein
MLYVSSRRAAFRSAKTSLAMSGEIAVNDFRNTVVCVGLLSSIVPDIATPPGKWTLTTSLSFRSESSTAVPLLRFAISWRRSSPGCESAAPRTPIGLKTG